MKNIQFKVEDIFGENMHIETISNEPTPKIKNF